MQGKKFISPGAWFSMIYPSDWNEFEDGEGSFLFYNPDVWTGNFRISAFKGGINYAKETIKQELKANSSSVLVKIGEFDCAYSKEMFQEDNQYFTSHLWITGVGSIVFECSFTVEKGGQVKDAEDVIATLEVRDEKKKYPAELIPIRLSEVYQINESYEWTVAMIKKSFAKDFQGSEEDLLHIQQLVDSSVIGAKKKEEWLAVGITICSILANEIEDTEWKTLIDGNREVPILTYHDRMIDPMKLVWSKIKAGEKCDVLEEYKKCIE